MSAEPSSQNCPAGGNKIEIGVDANRNGTLEVGEVAQVGYACNYSRPRIVFVTSTTSNGNLGGVSGAATRCQNAANAIPALAGKTFDAWISTSSSTPSGRFTRDGHFVRMDGTMISHSWSHLTGGTLYAAINVTETSSTVGGSFVWSSTTSSGAYKSGGNHCSSWSSNSSGNQGAVGSTAGTSSAWTDSTNNNCNNTRALYCFEQ